MNIGFLIAWTFLTGEGFAGPARTDADLTLHKEDVRLRCWSDHMLLDIDLHALPGVGQSTLHLQNASCGPHAIKGSHVSFTVPLRGCGTTQSSTDRFLLFSNAVANSGVNESKEWGVSFDPEFFYPFTCRYQKEYWLQLASAHGISTNTTARPTEKRSQSAATRITAQHLAPLALGLLVALWCSGFLHP